eukprot:GHVU01088431.1.p2 GENE.GHVU01088431.1~~GHVU01088431.1.p2  ORF type:complete len:136 (+),score=16.98 GHVU01088431.1:180-587(+)
MYGWMEPTTTRQARSEMRGTDAREATGTAAAAIAADAAATVQPITSGAWRGGEYKISNPNIHSFVCSFTYSFGLRVQLSHNGDDWRDGGTATDGGPRMRVWMDPHRHTHTHTHTSLLRLGRLRTSLTRGVRTHNE